MDYRHGYIASYSVAVVDPRTWLDVGWLKIISGSTSRSETGLRQSADMTVRRYDKSIDKYVRVYLDTNQNGARAREPLFTGIATSPGDDHKEGVTDIRIQCYSVLKDAEDISLPLGWYAPAGASTAIILRQLFKGLPEPLIIAAGSPALSENIVAEASENVLTMTDKILTAINWRAQITGRGEIMFSPKPTDPAEYFGLNRNAVVETDFSHGRDFFNCPNVLRVSAGNESYIARDDDPNSPLSTVSRGREVQRSEDNITLAESETLQAYGVRRLRELQQMTETAQYTRLYLPGINVGDIVELNYPELKGRYTVTGQTMQFGAPCSVQESVKRVV